MRITSVATFILVAVGCGGDGTAAPPDPSIVATVIVTPGTTTLLSLNETVQLAGVARNAAGAPAAGAVLTWSSSDVSVVSVSSAGLATGHRNGTATISVASGGMQGTAAVVVAQAVASMENTLGANQGATVGTALDTVLTFVVRDALGSAVPAAVIDFTPASGSGSVAPAQSTADAAGVVTTTWTLGTTAGEQALYASPAAAPTIRDTLFALAFAGYPRSIASAGGNDQSELGLLALPAPIAVRVLDEFGNAIADLPVVFTLTGDGTLDSTDVVTDLSGIARTTWTLGASLGMQGATAMIPDSAIAEGVVVNGGPVGFSATAVEFALGAFTTVPIAGASTTINGTGFAVDPAGQTVTVDGAVATITGGTQSSLVFTVPSFGCVPGRARTVSITRNGATRDISPVVQPEGLLALAPGEHQIRAVPADGCIQLPADADDEYLVGLTVTRELNAEVPFMLSGHEDDGSPSLLQSSSVRSLGIAALRSASGAVSSGTRVSLNASAAERHRSHRAWQSRFLSTRRQTARAASLRLVPRTASAVGDLLAIRIPDFTTDACNDFTPVSARVLAEGPRLVIATDAAFTPTPLQQIALDAALTAVTTQFGSVIYEAATAWFGVPSDLDADGRVTIVLSNVVTAMGVPAFSSAVDALARAVCPSSNEGEVVYVGLPPGVTAGTFTERLGTAVPELAHEFVHVIQANRIARGGVPMAGWLEEGQAELGAEVVGFLTVGNVARTDLAANALVGALPQAWYGPRFRSLSALFGWDGQVSRLAGAPGRCSLFGFGGLSVPCTAAYATGAGWSFMRYVLDRAAANFAGGESAFMRQLVTTEIGTDGTALLETLTGSTLEDLMVEWAMTLYVDGRVMPALAPRLQFPSWNLASIFAAMPAEQRLQPDAFSFQDFSHTGSVVGGGTAFMTVSSTGAHGPLALRMRDPSGNALGTAMAPRLWVVRVR